MDYNPFLPEVYENPYPYYAHLRQHAPIYCIDGIGFWALSRYDDVASVLRNHELFSSATVMGALLGDLSFAPPDTPFMIGTDPPAHTRLRNLVNRAFTPRRVADIEAHIREITAQLIDQIAARGECDLIADFAVPLPVIVIAEMLGVEPERREDFKRWSDHQALAATGMVTADQQQQIRQSKAEFHAYFQEMIERRRREPHSDLISALVRAQEGDQTLTSAEILGLTVLLLIAGNETTTNLIGNATLALLEYPEELAKVRANPALIPNMLEETLRYDPPVHIFLRQTMRDCEIAGTALPAGAMVMPIYASANRDERRYPDPDRFDVTRDTQGHIGFGIGIHYCVGAPLSRVEAKVAFEALLSRFPRLVRAEAPLTRIASPFFRGLKSLPLMCEARRRGMVQ